jgi:hypothetical protein
VRACLFAALLMIGGCTLVHIEGEHNAVTDVGGHGGGIQLLERTPAAKPFPHIVAQQR